MSKAIKLTMIGFFLCLIAGLTAITVRETLKANSAPRTDTPHSKDGATLLHNGWVIKPVGRPISIGDMPVAIMIANDYCLVATAGFDPHQVHAFNMGSLLRTLGASLEQPWASITLSNIWRGMAAGKGDKRDIIYVGGGNRAQVWRLRLTSQGELMPIEPLKLPEKTWAGAVVACADNTLITVDEATGRLYKLEDETGQILSQVQATRDAGALCLSNSGETVYVANQGASTVTAYQVQDLKKIADYPVGKHPVALAISSDDRWLFVANSGSDTVSIIDLNTGTIKTNVRTAMSLLAPVSSLPNSLALAPGDKTLYITNGGNNNICVIDLGDNPTEARVKGFIPTAYYPSAIAMTANGKELLIATGKFIESKPNYPPQPNTVTVITNEREGQKYGAKSDKSVRYTYIPSLMTGTLTHLPVPDEKQLADYTRQCIENSPYRDELLQKAVARPKDCPIPDAPGQACPIEHVLYIIKENRTYDQVFGDLPQGNGDPNLVLFGEEVTPNHRALAREFVLLDNLYCDGEVSVDGHEWSNAAMASDYIQKAWPTQYAGRPTPPGTLDVRRAPNGYLWDLCAKHGLTFRSYGEKTNDPGLKGNVSETWNAVKGDGPKRPRDYLKADVFIQEFREYEKNDNLPRFIVMSLGEDHTSGTTPNAYTPYASVASNDYALGKVVEAVSNSKYWRKIAIFVIEDDAQNGPDHVDAHRTVGLVISPYTRRKSVDHTFYTTSGMLRTMELILGLPPMSQYDAGATPMFRCFTNKPNLKPYKHLPPRVDLDEVNGINAPMASVSKRLNFEEYDFADFDTLNRILWAAIKGKQPYPGTTASAFVR
jgi:YVTN family beta-propeller protein